MSAHLSGSERILAFPVVVGVRAVGDGRREREVGPGE